MAINDIAPLDVGTSNGTAAPADAHGSNKLGKDQFLQLLMAQLSHQDPTSPADGNAFVAQLAQFASLEMAQNTNSNLEQLLAGQAAGNQTSALGLVGKQVVFRTDPAHPDRGDVDRHQRQAGGSGGAGHRRRQR